MYSDLGRGAQTGQRLLYSSLSDSHYSVTDPARVSYISVCVCVYVYVCVCMCVCVCECVCECVCV